MPRDNFYYWFTQATTELLTKNSDVFQALGLNLFRGFAVILIVWFGVQVALSTSSGAVLRWNRFAALLLTIAFGYAMITYYQAPIPGIGRSFYKLITDQGAELANQIEFAGTEQLGNALTEIYQNMEQPTGASMLNPLAIIRYFAVVFLISAAQFAVLAVICYGFLAVGICVLVGPVFVPFFIVPNLEWLFWGWLRCLIQYAFYPVVGNAFVYVFGQMLLNFLDQHPGPYSGSMIAALFLQFAFLLTAFVWGVLKVPALTSSIFSGRAGDHALPGIAWWR